jgi:hypothetical protein
MTTPMHSASRSTLRDRAQSLLAEISAARRKEHRLKLAIKSRQETLNRLEAQIALSGEIGPVRPTDE